MVFMFVFFLLLLLIDLEIPDQKSEIYFLSTKKQTGRIRLTQPDPLKTLATTGFFVDPQAGGWLTHS